MLRFFAGLKARASAGVNSGACARDCANLLWEIILARQ